MHQSKRFMEFIDHFCQRPAMYIGTSDLKLAINFLHGYSRGWENASGRWPLIGNWSTLSRCFYWLEYKYVVNSIAWPTERILLHFHNHDEIAAIRAIPGLLQEFVAGSIDLTYAQLDAQTEKVVYAKYGDIKGSPTCAECK